MFPGRDISEQRNYGEAVARQIDVEVKRIVSSAFAQAKDVLTTYCSRLGAVANRLIAAESLDGDELAQLVGTTPLTRPPTSVAIPAETIRHPVRDICERLGLALAMLRDGMDQDGDQERQ